MKLQYKKQRFQEDAANAVVETFYGQPKQHHSYSSNYGLYTETNFGNQTISKVLTPEDILKNIRNVQIKNGIEPSSSLEGKYNLSIEMETGVGKTYTYIKTMYELNKHYGWSKFIVVVPSIAIREGVYKSFQSTEDHFAEEYGKKIRFFIYDSDRLNLIDDFASDSNINVMIINAQAFNKSVDADDKLKQGKKADKKSAKIFRELDSFGSRRPIDVIAATNPILIIDEPQSVEGEKTKKNLKEFNALFTLRYSATLKEQFNKIYRLDALDAYQKKLVKKIAVKGVSETSSLGTSGYLSLINVIISSNNPKARIECDVKSKTGILKKVFICKKGDDIFEKSKGLNEYKNGFTIIDINARDNYVEFKNGLMLYAGEVSGATNDEDIRRIQIRETISSHIEKERQLFDKRIKVLSLFFIDEVANYRVYKNGVKENGIYADIFEEEYKNAVKEFLKSDTSKDYSEYLSAIKAESTHQGYFSIDNSGHFVNSKIDKKENASNDVSAYDLIMKDKELLLERNPNISPVRFIFSHSALKEGWDNPNVFQICTLKDSSSEIRKRQEVGRGMRLCVNEDGERQDASVLGQDIHNINVLTVVASESYDDFAKKLQEEISESISDRPSVVTEQIFIGKILIDKDGNPSDPVDEKMARLIHGSLFYYHYVTPEGKLTKKYFDDSKTGNIELSDNVATYEKSIIEILNNIYDPEILMPEDVRSRNLEVKFNEKKFRSKEFQGLWNKINQKSSYAVSFDSKDLVCKAIDKINELLSVSKVMIRTESGSLDTIKSKEQLVANEAFNTPETDFYEASSLVSKDYRVDIVERIVDETSLTRKDVVDILKGISDEKFEMLKNNPEDFIRKTSDLINDAKAYLIVDNISYNVIGDNFDVKVFSENTINGKSDGLTIPASNSLYDFVVCDSTEEKEFVKLLDKFPKMAVYVKLPLSFYITTPVGKYSPDWAIAFKENSGAKKIYFVAETKGSEKPEDRRDVENAKIACAKKHFSSISGEKITYDVVSTFDSLKNKIL